MGAPQSNPTVLHIGEAAGTAAAMVAEARRRGYHWDQIPLASTRRDWSGPVAQVQRAALGAAWVAKVGASARRHDIVQIHSASTWAHARYAGIKRFVLFCHGSDVRSGQYDSVLGPRILEALHRAEAVMYATPDLAEHVLPHRPDAHYFPIPVTPSVLPTWRRPARPRIVFASRWEEVKGLEQQLAMARSLIEALGDDADVVGLDWGPDARRARELGVELVPTMARTDYLDWLATATAVVGQASGILATSELETLGIGTPLLLPVPLPLYADDPPPVTGRDVVTAAAAARLLVDGADHDPTPGHDWMVRVSGVEAAVDHLSSIYDDVLRRRQG